jgi:hypothetical protein
MSTLPYRVMGDLHGDGLSRTTVVAAAGVTVAAACRSSVPVRAAGPTSPLLLPVLINYAPPPPRRWAGYRKGPVL